MKNYYDILGVTEDASKDTIRKAFKEIAKKEHPDRGGDESKFKEANEAYDTLKDSKKRQEYDTIRKFGQPGTGGNFSFRSGDFFGVGFLCLRSRQRSSRRGTPRNMPSPLVPCGRGGFFNNARDQKSYL